MAPGSIFRIRRAAATPSTASPPPAASPSGSPGQGGGSRGDRNARSFRRPPWRLPRRRAWPRLPAGQLRRPGRPGHRRPWLPVGRVRSCLHRSGCGSAGQAPVQPPRHHRGRTPGRLVPVDGATGKGGPPSSRARGPTAAQARDLPGHHLRERRQRRLPGTTLLDPEQYPAAELVALYRERWEIELAFDEIKNHLGPGGPRWSRTPQGDRQELWAHLAVHHAIRQFAHTTALVHPPADADRISYLKCVRIVRRSIPSQLGATATKLTRSFAEAGREARAHLLPARRGRDCPRAKPNR
ncbi:transposase [Streptomyces sp. NPDC058877]|uniref:transposase n=1 Tax=unclassified Streptomyces TaxID=2593676 RepID=UPI003685E673